jgi:hypothetical protein
MPAAQEFSLLCSSAVLLYGDQMMTTPEANTTGKLYPTLTEGEQREADERLKAYLALVLRLYARISTDPDLRRGLEAALKQERTARPRRRRGAC